MMRFPPIFTAPLCSSLMHFIGTPLSIMINSSSPIPNWLNLLDGYTGYVAVSRNTHTRACQNNTEGREGGYEGSNRMQIGWWRKSKQIWELMNKMEWWTRGTFRGYTLPRSLRIDSYRNFKHIGLLCPFGPSPCNPWQLFDEMLFASRPEPTLFIQSVVGSAATRAYTVWSYLERY